MPPVAERPLVPEHMQALARYRTISLALAIGIDVLIWLLLRNSPQIDQTALRIFAAGNIGLLGFDLLTTALPALRAARPNRALIGLGAVLEALTTVVWLQLTGSVSSYFLIMGVLLVVFYRFAYDYRTGLIQLGALVIFHGVAFALEQAGVLPYSSLFPTAPGGIVSSPLYRWAAFFSIQSLWVMLFAGANLTVRLLERKDRALQAARRELERAFEMTQIGRLSGAVLAGRYQIAEMLGRGGMGEVYQARRVSDGAEVAVKVLHAHLGDTPGMRERFRREAEVVSRLPGDTVAAIYETGADEDGTDFIVMARLRGEDLGAILRRTTLISLEELADLVADIARALAPAHAIGVVHRDLKPQNIFLTAGGEDGRRVRILDFGIARLLEGDATAFTMTSTVLGSAGFLAPEQARGDQRAIGTHTDVFAMGAIVYRALSGQSAFPSRSPAAAIYEALNHRPPPPGALRPDLDGDVDRVLALALAKRIEDRYADVGLFAADFALALKGRLSPERRTRADALDTFARPADETLTREERRGGGIDG
jgi:hypothetical protein